MTRLMTSPFHWMMRGAMVGVLLCAALNGASYFLRSSGGGNLLGNAPERREALGFPLEMWESQNTFGGYFIDPGPLAINLLFGLVVAGVGGAIVLWFRPSLDRLEGELLASFPDEAETPFQFSLRNLMILMGLVAVVAAGVRYAQAGRHEVLAAFYFFGPWLLVIIPFLPAGLSWRKRVVLVIPFTMLLMISGIAIGAQLQPAVEFDKVLLGTFVCWTPQTVIAALLITILVLWHWRRTRVSGRAVEPSTHRQFQNLSSDIEGASNKLQAR